MMGQPDQMGEFNQMDEVDRGESYVRRVRIDGEPRYEIGVKDIDEDGYLIDYIEFSPDDTEEEIEREIEAAIDELFNERERSLDDPWEDNWPDTF